MPKICSYTICHYGISYLPFSLRGVYDSVDELHVFYTPHPSHGHDAQVPPVETRQDILSSLMCPPFWTGHKWNGKLAWHETDFWQEGEQRNHAVKTLADTGAQLILIVDYDEIWHEDVLRSALSHVWEANSAREWRVNMVHLWRSFDYCCRDDAWPARIIDLRHSSGVGYIPKELGEIFHFGYAVTDKVMFYKWSIHGHKDELRPDWLETKWAAWPPVSDCHPTNGRKSDGSGWWDPEPFDKGRLPGFMGEHLFYNLERIA